MNSSSLTPGQLEALACEDCPAQVRVGRLQGLAGVVLAVVVDHAVTCPWLARVAPEGAATITGQGGIVRHQSRREDR